MERVTHYLSPSQHRRRLPSHSTDTLQPPASTHRSYVGRGGVVLFRVEENIEETRDDHQLSSQRMGAETTWKPTYGVRRGQGYPLSFREVPRHERRSISSSRHHVHRHWHPDNRWYTGRCHDSIMTYSSIDHQPSLGGGMVPISTNGLETRRRQNRFPSFGYQSNDLGYRVVEAFSQCHGEGDKNSERPNIREPGRFPTTSRHHIDTRRTSIVVIPNRIVIPREMTPGSEILTKNADAISPKQKFPVGQNSSDARSGDVPPRLAKRVKTSENDRLEGNFDKLDLLCSATLELGPLQDNPTGCSCPKSKCIALYCDCFKAGRRCNPKTCTCLNCKNTVAESGPDGARAKAIQSILARNPRAFTNAGNSTLQNKGNPGEHACNCIRSRCLKLYCTCFQVGKTCNPHCSCVSCLNTDDDVGGHRHAAIEATLEKRPDAFQKPKVKEIGSGCACKNNRCIRKYCECFRTNLPCTKKCSCRDCGNLESLVESDERSSTHAAKNDTGTVHVQV